MRSSRHHYLLVVGKSGCKRQYWRFVRSTVGGRTERIGDRQHDSRLCEQRRRTGIPPPRAPKPKPKTSSGGSSNDEREQGSVKWFNTNKGYGFIARDSGGEIFVHYRSIQGNGRRFLRDGQRVEFTVGEGEKGPQAEDVGVV